MQGILYVTAKELGDCPAAVHMDTGIKEINTSVWNNYSEFEKRFILEHENGHYILQTDDESEADKYALEKVYGKYHKSLKRSIATLHKIGIIDQDRMRQLYIEALKIDVQKNGNKKAAKELNNLGLNAMKEKMTLNNGPLGSIINKRRADGAETTNTQSAQVIAQNLRDRFMSQVDSQFKKTGFIVQDHFISYEVVVLVVILFFVAKIANK